MRIAGELLAGAVIGVCAMAFAYYITDPALWVAVFP
jgi:hypothetical protein